LKLREGAIENALIYYEREDIPEPKQSRVILYQAHPAVVLKDILTKALGIRVIVEKRREIYVLENIKLHIDTVHNLGSFVEIEAIDRDGTIGPQQLWVQCQSLCDTLDIRPEDFVSGSYSDLLLRQRESVIDPAQH
jgi:predicted adenylyl cyclase CyaB